MPLDIVILGLSVSSSWGNGHATTYRALAKALTKRGHRVLFAERDQPWYRANRDLPEPEFCELVLYDDLAGLLARVGQRMVSADLVMQGSYVPDGIAIADWITRDATGVTAFYDIDTPVTLAGLASGSVDYISASLVPRFDLYLSFAGGPALEVLEKRYGSPAARAFYCSADPEVHRPMPEEAVCWDLGYLGTYSADRQPLLEELLIAPASALPDRRFVIAGAQYPSGLRLPGNVERIEHVAPGDHARFYARQRFTLNVTRQEMTALGYAPSVRLMEAAACGGAILSDPWPGLDEIFTPGAEILIAEQASDVIAALTQLPDSRRKALGAAARRRVLKRHSAERRARELEALVADAAKTLKLAHVNDVEARP